MKLVDKLVSQLEEMKHPSIFLQYILYFSCPDWKLLILFGRIDFKELGFEHFWSNKSINNKPYNEQGGDETIAQLCFVDAFAQKYSRLRCLLRVKGLVIYFYLGWSGSILQFRQNMIKVGSKSWLLTCSSNITFS